MKATREYVLKKFGEFNKSVFNGRLPDIPIELLDSGSYLGLCVSDVLREPDGRKIHTNFKLRINSRADLDEKVIEDTILHEMIHYFIHYNGLIDSAPHGYIFKAIMTSINNTYGRHLTITHRGTPEEREQMISTRRTWHILAILNMKNGNKGVKVLPRNAEKVIKYTAAAKSHPEIISVDLWLHDNPFFNRFPTSAALKYHDIAADILATHLEGGRLLKIVNGNHLVEANRSKR